MKKFLNIKSLLLFFLALVFSFSFYFFETRTVYAGLDTFPDQYMQCSRHGHNETKDCGSDYTYLYRDDYSFASINYYIRGHRHGGSSINASICLLDFAANGACMVPPFSCSGSGCGAEDGGIHWWWLLRNGTLSSPATGGSIGYYVYRSASVKDAEVRVGYDGYAIYPDAPAPIVVPPPPGESNVLFYVHANCSAEAIPGAQVDLGGGSIGYTDNNGYVNLTVPENTPVNWTASANGYTGTSGGLGSSGPDGTTNNIDVTLTRDCFSEPPVPTPPPEVTPPGCTADDNAVVTFLTPPPASVAPNQVVSFTVRAQNTGNTKWWKYFDNSGYKLVQQVNYLNITSSAPVGYTGLSYGHMPYQVDVGDYVDWTFNMIAPSTPGSYSLKMGMIHSGAVNIVAGFWDYRLQSDSSTGGCPLPLTTFSFGNAPTASFTVDTPVITADASINTSAVNPDDVTQYIITTIGTNTAGADKIHRQYALINYLGPNGGQYRGYIRWVKDAAADPGPALYEQQFCTGTGGGYAYIYTNPTPATEQFGSEYIHLDSCSVSDSGNTKTAQFTVRFTPLFVSPVSDNYIATYVRHDDTAGPALWQNNVTPFTITASTLPTVSYGCGAVAPGSSACSTTSGGSVNLYWTTANATTCLLDSNPVGLNSAPGQTSGPLAGSIVSNLVCSGPGGTTSKSVTITVSAPTPGTPTGLSSACNSAGTQVTVAWSAATNATDYLLRLNNTTNDAPACTAGWLCTDPPDRAIDNYSLTNYTMTVVPNQLYEWWVHGNNTGGFGTAALETFTCVPAASTYPLTVTTNPSPRGSVVSTDALINCGVLGVVCSANYTIGSTVTLQAIPASSYWKFTGWAGSCSGSGSCTLNITSPKTVTALFAPREFDYIEF